MFEEDDDDSTAPAQFLLKLPPSYSRKLAALSPPTPGEWALPVHVVAEQAPVADTGARRRVIGFVAGVAVAVAIVVGVGGAFTQSSASGGPVGISKHAPKALDHVFRTASRQSGVAHVHAVAVVEKVQRHAKRKH